MSMQARIAGQADEKMPPGLGRRLAVGALTWLAL